MTLSKKVGLNIRRARQEKKPRWPRHYLSELSGVSEASIAAIELNRRAVSVAALERLAEALEVTVIDLLTRDPEAEA